MYQDTKNRSYTVELVQTGVRIEKRLLKVMKALAEYHDLTLGDLIEGIVLHAFDGKCPFAAENLKRIAEFKKIYHLDLDSRASHKLVERKPAATPARPKAGRAATPPRPKPGRVGDPGAGDPGEKKS